MRIFCTSWATCQFLKSDSTPRDKLWVVRGFAETSERTELKLDASIVWVPSTKIYRRPLYTESPPYAIVTFQNDRRNSEIVYMWSTLYVYKIIQFKVNNRTNRNLVSRSMTAPPPLSSSSSILQPPLFLSAFIPVRKNLARNAKYYFQRFYFLNILCIWNFVIRNWDKSGSASNIKPGK